MSSSLTELRQNVGNLPSRPGIYIMKSAQLKILYIGKAKNIRKRVQSYLRDKLDKKTLALMNKVHAVEYVITQTEYEALLLENNLIKQHKPHYNINLKDGKSYPVIRVTADSYPRVFRTRNIVRDGSQYFGPFLNSGNLKTYLELIEKLYPLRRCYKKNLTKREHPCLYYHINKCAAPCAGKIGHDAYMQRIQCIIDLLNGKTDQLIDDLQKKMEKAAAEQRFEEAREHRDAIQSIIALGSGQSIVDFRDSARDYIACAHESNSSAFVVIRMRDGQMINTSSLITTVISPIEEHYSEFLMRYYQDATKPPHQIYIQYVETDIMALTTFFREALHEDVEINTVESQHDLRIMNMAIDNAWLELRKRSDTSLRENVLQEVQTVLGLPKLPRHIEGFDVAHIGGKHTVASMVCFIDGKPDSARYRKYHIKSLEPGVVDDFESIREVVARRYTRVKNEQGDLPDLILIDGGRGQVSSAVEILHALGLSVPVVGLAKREEKIIFPDDTPALLLPAGNPVLQLLQHVRDEAHRFATTFRKGLQGRELSASLLTSIPGIGDVRAKKILTRFESIGNALAVPPIIFAKALGVGIGQAKELQKELRSLEE